MSRKKIVALIVVLGVLVWSYFSGALAGLLRTIWLLSGDAAPYVSGALIVLLVLAFTRKKLILLAAVIVAVGWGGYHVMKENEAMERAEEAAITEIENNFVGVKSIEVTRTERSPMGSIFVSGHVNGDPELRFGLRIRSNFEIGRISTAPVFLERTPEFKSRERK